MRKIISKSVKKREEKLQLTKDAEMHRITSMSKTSKKSVNITSG